jgi:hypothetical protein
LSTVKKRVAFNVKIISINKEHVYIISCLLEEKEHLNLNFYGDEKPETMDGLNVVKTNGGENRY